MKIVQPITIGPADFYAYGDCPYPDYGWTHAYDLAQGVTIWSAATPYVIGAKVISTTTRKVYQAAAPSTGTDPATDATAATWVPLYTANAWRAFDGVVGNPCHGYSNGGPAQNSEKTLIFCLRPAQRFDTICLLDVDARSVTITYENAFGDIYSFTTLTADTSQIVDAWSYWFGDTPVTRNLVFEGLYGWNPTGPTDTRGLLTIEITSNASAVSVGEIILGRLRDLGMTIEGASLTLVDYSEKDVNQFGEATLIERPYAYRGAYDVSLPNRAAGNITNTIQDLRAVPCVFYPSVESAAQGLIQFGYLSEFRLTHRKTTETDSIAQASLQVEGLI